MRLATLEDSDALLAWRNDERTRQASVRQAVISRDGHGEWFRQSLANPTRRIYIAWMEGEDGVTERAGMCRFDGPDSEGMTEVSINLNPEFRGRGLSTPILRAAIDTYVRERGGLTALLARIRPVNTASVRTFGAVGFVYDGADDEEGFDRYRWSTDGD